ncbi:hypothetical protein AVEN_221997-1 [Araneus ventricosus]|uniref:Uncharacterized protein n=1 Tax=Araneus ventricosus TaxID=182803 RepID=A0A4Y2MDX4_ARAVE|nr:hypothetical protein AVEN_221997-1 [Araneus ventricosus]
MNILWSDEANFTSRSEYSELSHMGRTLLMALKVLPLRMPITATFFRTSHFCLTERECLEITVFMQDGALLHIVRAVQALLHAHFGDDQVFSRSFPTGLPPRSPDLNHCDFWLWGFLKNCIHGGSIRTLPELKANITRHVPAIDRETLRATIGHAITRFEYVLDADGMSIEHML